MPPRRSPCHCALPDRSVNSLTLCSRCAFPPPERYQAAAEVPRSGPYRAHARNSRYADVVSCQVNNCNLLVPKAFAIMNGTRPDAQAEVQANRVIGHTSRVVFAGVIGDNRRRRAVARMTRPAAEPAKRAGRHCLISPENAQSLEEQMRMLLASRQCTFGITILFFYCFSGSRQT